MYDQSDAFYAMLGLGPIVEGYSLIATIAHAPSMLDLSGTDVDKLVAFTDQIRQSLASHYGQAIITEHGRVAPCVDHVRDRQQAHCFHAHRLVFPVSVDLTAAITKYGLEISEYASFKDCWRQFSWRGEYLYYERVDGTCLVAVAPMRTVRQFFRYKVAELVGYPELADWNEYPRPRVIESAMRRLIPRGE